MSLLSSLLSNHLVHCAVSAALGAGGLKAKQIVAQAKADWEKVKAVVAGLEAKAKAEVAKVEADAKKVL